MERMKRKHRVKCSDEIISKQSKSLELLCAKRPFAQQNGNNTLIRPSMSTNYTVLHWNFSSTKNFTLKHNYEFEKCSLINCIKTFFCVWFFLNANRCFKYLPKWLYTILNIMDVYFVCSSRQLTTKNNNLHKPELGAHGQEPHVLLQHCHCSGCMCQITNTQYLSIEKWDSSHWKPFVCVTMSSSRFPLNPVKSSVSLFYIPQPLHNERCHRGKFKHCQNIKRSAAPLQIQPLLSSEMWYSLLL